MNDYGLQVNKVTKLQVGKLTSEQCNRASVSTKHNGIPRLRHLAPVGFTLIELLVSMTILIIMTMIMTKIISDSTRAVDLGYQQAMMDGNARAFLDNILDDLNQAVAAEGLAMQVDADDFKPYDENLFASDRLRFFAMIGPAGCDTDLKIVEYRIDEPPTGEDFYILKRGDECAESSGASANKYPLLDYVVQFKVKLWGYNNQGQFRELQSTTQLPQYAEIMLTTVSDKLHDRAMQFDAAERRDYLLRHGRRHYVQATFPMAKARHPDYDYYDPN